MARVTHGEPFVLARSPCWVSRSDPERGRRAIRDGCVGSRCRSRTTDNAGGASHLRPASALPRSRQSHSCRQRIPGSDLRSATRSGSETGNPARRSREHESGLPRVSRASIVRAERRGNAPGRWHDATSKHGSTCPRPHANGVGPHVLRARCTYHLHGGVPHCCRDRGVGCRQDDRRDTARRAQGRRRCVRVLRLGRCSIGPDEMPADWMETTTNEWIRRLARDPADVAVLDGQTKPTFALRAFADAG